MHKISECKGRFLRWLFEIINKDEYSLLMQEVLSLKKKACWDKAENGMESNELSCKMREKLVGKKKNPREYTDESAACQLLELNINYTCVLSVLWRTMLDIPLCVLNNSFF